MTNKMANTEEDEELYENLKRNPKLHRYDEITINFGKPVILANHHNNSSIGKKLYALENYDQFPLKVQRNFFREIATPKSNNIPILKYFPFFLL